MSDAADPSELFHVQMDELAGTTALVTIRRLGFF
jgi:hypothetical protein